MQMTRLQTALIHPRRSAAKRLVGFLAWVLLAFTLVASGPSFGQSTSDGKSLPDFKNFDHSVTGFALTGAHATTDCESCHVGGKLTGTPTTCVACHDGVNAKGRSATHPKSGDDCTTCHGTTNWRPVAMDHSMVVGDCASCHNGEKASGKSKGHPPTEAECASCHQTAKWSTVRMDHAATKAACVECHDGTVSKGMARDHLPTSLNCQSCHVTDDWAKVVMDHTQTSADCCSLPYRPGPVRAFHDAPVNHQGLRVLPRHRDLDRSLLPA